MSYYCAKALMGGSSNMITATRGLVGEINVKYPNRDHSSDGWIGDTSHAARKSDHNPDYGDGGIVRAVDIDINGPTGTMTPIARDVLRATIGHPAVYYVIFDYGIYSRTRGFRRYPYTGSNPHDHHVHVSLLDSKYENMIPNWLEDPFKLQPLRVSISAVREQFMIAADMKRGTVSVNNGVGRIQHVLVHTQGAKLSVDGVCGPRTVEAFRKFEFEKGGLGKDRIPDRKSLAILSNKGKRFGLVA